jgi:hypothetical protein
MLPPLATIPAPEPATALLQPAGAAAVTGLGALGTATTLLLPAEAAAARGLGIPGPATALPPPAEVATHAHGAANNLLRAEAAQFNRAGSSLQPTGSKATAHPQTATSASLLPDGVVRGALGALPGACAYFSPRVGTTEAPSAGS